MKVQVTFDFDRTQREAIAIANGVTGLADHVLLHHFMREAVYWRIAEVIANFGPAEES